MKPSPKKILIITPEFPYPINSGGRQAQYHLIEKLRDIYSLSILFSKNAISDTDYDDLRLKWPNVTFYPFSPKIDDKKYISLGNRIYHFFHSCIKKFFLRNSSKEKVKDERSTSRLYTSMQFWFSNDFIEYVYNISHKNFDIIQVEFYEYLPLIYLFPHDKQRIFVHHEIRYIRNKLEKSLFSKSIIQDDYIYELAKKFELTNLNCYDKIITLSEIDKIKLQKDLKVDNIYASPALVQIEDKPNYSNFEFNNNLVFLGNSLHYPNEDALKWFISDIWPHVLEKNKNISLHLIGDWQNFILDLDFSPSNIIVHGFVKDLSLVLPNSIMVVPVRIGSGIRIKILDAINYNIPFITTSIGVEGLDFTNGKDCLIADTSHDFIDSINKLVRDDKFANSLISESRLTLNRFYNEDLLLQKRIDVYEA